ncbi:hypothetical protein KIW84_065799 [Lathyrus oleraceus]|uniref:TF-B3 domain-containing protein n=1 Tax=Pisum sativum TaxID=3888 RepID=A0A9D4WHU6_PEA|nr:hypothetical protein KIW84_065799 [Pisum sativum]
MKTHVQILRYVSFVLPVFSLCSRSSTIKTGDGADRGKEKTIAVKAQPADVVGEETTTDGMQHKRKRNIGSIDSDTWDGYHCKLHFAERNKNGEKFMYHGWTNFAKKRKLKRGDVVPFSLRYPPR